MKKLAAIAVIATLTVSAFAQGTITWGNSSGTAIRFATPGGTDPGQGGANPGDKVFSGANYVVGLYLGAAGATDPSALTLVTTRTFHTAGTASTSALSGVFLASTFTSAIATGTTVTYMIKAWSAGFASYEAAIANPVPKATMAGVSGIGAGSLGGGPTPAFAASLSATGVATGAVGTGAVAPFTIAIVPEPATASLVGLGLASLLIFRRRK